MVATRRSLLLAVVLSGAAFAQELTPPPLPPAPSEAVIAPPEAPPPADDWAERCLSRPTGYYGPRLWVPRPAVAVSEPIVAGGSSHGAKPAPSGTGHVSGSGSGGTGGGGNLGAALLVAAVVVVAALPVIFYALDEEAQPDVVGRYRCPSFEVDVGGGLETDGLRGTSVPMTVRLKASTEWLGVMAQFDVAPWSAERRLLDSRVAAVVRFTPREHVELGLSAGYRSQVLRDVWRPGFEAALPHEYVFFRDGAAHVGLEVRPAVFVWSHGVDLSLEAALRIPLGQVVSLSLGGRVFSIDALTQIGAGVQGGVGVKL